jgi:hypothetical protein
MTMNVREFSAALQDALEAIGKAENADDTAAAAERRATAAETRLQAAAEAHAKLKAQSDAHLATSLDRLNAETERHHGLVADAQKKLAQLDEAHKAQIENATVTLTQLNTDVGVMRKAKDELAIDVERQRNMILDLAKKL